MLSRLCGLYGGTTPNYWLDEHSLEDWQMYLAYGEEAALKDMQVEARILAGTILTAYAGKSLPPLRDKPLIVTERDQSPDRKALRRAFHFKDGKATRGGETHVGDR